MATNNNNTEKIFGGGKHPVLTNLVVIIVIAALGLWIVYLSLALFTKHGQNEVVPNVENMTYTQAVELLHSQGFRVDIRDSVYRDDVKPGLVVEQFPKVNSIVKPGRKIFLYINAVNPKEVVIDDDNIPGRDALKGMSFRQAYAHLEELGFTNITVVKVLGDDDRVVKVLADGKTVKKMERVSVKARIVLEICDGRLSLLRDSLQNIEYGNNPVYDNGGFGEYSDEYGVSSELNEVNASSDPEPVNEVQTEAVEGAF